MSANLLVELFTEELPPKALRRLGEAFAEGIAAGLAARGLARRSEPHSRLCNAAAAGREQSADVAQARGP